jgi:putative alpha-1,2-mannosidase
VNNIAVDMTATHHTSLFRFKFPAKTAQGASPLIFLDLSDMSDSRQDNATITVDAKTGRMSGGARFNPSFGQGSYFAYFCADFNGAQIRDSGIYVNSRASAAVKELKISRSINGYPLPGGAFLRFRPIGSSSVLVRVGVSFLNPEQACRNAEKEIPDFKFDAVKTAAETLWRNKLNPVRVSMNKVNGSVVKNFYRYENTYR